MPILRQVEASSMRALNPFTFYAQENRARVNAAILEEDTELRRRLDAGENHEGSDSDICEDYCDANADLLVKGNSVMREEFKSVSESEKQRFQELAVESRFNQFRRLRENGRLIENDESLAQRAEDERKGILGPVGIGQSGGSGGPTGTLIGGQILTTSRQELTPPFERNTLRIKTGKIEAEEYF